MILKNVKIILNNVADSGNIGAVCRVMKNMGLSQLRLVRSINFEKDIQFNIDQIYARAVHSIDIWGKVCFFDNLAEAVKDCSVVVGTTRRRGQHRKNTSMSPRALAGWLAEHPGLAGDKAAAALVFGNERTGLEDAELALCNIASHIPADEAQPSLNLSHAVQVYAYELYMAAASLQNAAAAQHVKGEWVPMNQEQISSLVSLITNNLEKIGFYKQYGRDEQERFLRDVIARAGLCEKEGRYFKDLLIKAARMNSNEN